MLFLRIPAGISSSFFTVSSPVQTQRQQMTIPDTSWRFQRMREFRELRNTVKVSSPFALSCCDKWQFPTDIAYTYPMTLLDTDPPYDVICPRVQENQRLVSRVYRVQRLVRRARRQCHLVATRLDQHGDNYREAALRAPADGPAAGSDGAGTARPRTTDTPDPVSGKRIHRTWSVGIRWIGPYSLLNIVKD